MTRLSKAVWAERTLAVKNAAEKVGAQLLTPKVTSATQKLQFTCSVCGKVHETTWQRFKLGVNPAFLCSDCNPKSKMSFSAVKASLEKTGARILTEEKDYKNCYSSLEFICSVPECENTGHIVLANYRQGLNPHVRCYEHGGCQSPEIDYVRKKFSEKGAVLLSESFETADTPLKFECSSCGKEHTILWSNFIRGHNSKLLCADCMNKHRYTYADVKQAFFEAGITLLSNEYRNPRTRLYYICPVCGNITNTTFEYFRILTDAKKQPVCKECSSMLRANPANIRSRNRHNCDRYGWERAVANLYNVPYGLYSIHHLYGYTDFPEAQRSITNGYPLPKDIHPVIKSDKKAFGNPPVSSFPDSLKVHPGSYSLQNLHDFLQTDLIIFPEKMDTIRAKKEASAQYVPFFVHEIVPSKMNAVSSFIREACFPYVPDVYSQTGKPRRVLFAEKLHLKMLSEQEQICFFWNNYIKHVPLQPYAAGLFTDAEEIVSAVCWSVSETAIHIGAFTYANDTHVHGAFDAFLPVVKQNGKTLEISLDARLCTEEPENMWPVRKSLWYAGRTAPEEICVDADTLLSTEPGTTKSIVFTDLGSHLYIMK